MHYFDFCHGQDYDKGFHLDLEIHSLLVKAVVVAKDFEQWVYIMYDEEHNVPYTLLEDEYRASPPIIQGTRFRTVTPQGDHYCHEYLKYPEDD